MRVAFFPHSSHLVIYWLVMTSYFLLCDIFILFGPPPLSIILFKLPLAFFLLHLIWLRNCLVIFNIYLQSFFSPHSTAMSHTVGLLDNALNFFGRFARTMTFRNMVHFPFYRRKFRLCRWSTSFKSMAREQKRSIYLMFTTFPMSIPAIYGIRYSTLCVCMVISFSFYGRFLCE